MKESFVSKKGHRMPVAEMGSRPSGGRMTLEEHQQLRKWHKRVRNGDYSSKRHGETRRQIAAMKAEMKKLAK